MQRYFSILILTLLLGLAACQTNRLRAFGDVRRGMSKGDVLNIMGSPSFTQRWRGMDRWTYNLYERASDEPINPKQVREVHFAEGVAVYAGPEVKPAVSPEEQDRLNLLRNEEAEVRERNSQRGESIQIFKPVDPESVSAERPSTGR